jgi:hypothetical protein
MTPSSFPMRSWPLASPLRHQGCKASEVEQARVHCNSYHPGCLASSRDLEILRGHQGDGDMSDRKRPAGCSRTVSARLVTGLMTLRCFSEPCSEQVTQLLPKQLVGGCVEAGPVSSLLEYSSDAADSLLTLRHVERGAMFGLGWVQHGWVTSYALSPFNMGPWSRTRSRSNGFSPCRPWLACQ